MARPTSAEKGFGKFFDDGWIVAFATKDIEISAIGVIGEVTADQRRLDQLHHAIPGNTSFSKMDDLAGAIPLHLNQVTELHHIGFDLVGIPNTLRNAIVEVN
jgi:hypothetical protein